MPDTVLLTQEPLSLQKAQDAIGHPSAGGESYFVGTTRDNFDGKTVTLLEYEAYDTMAIKQMKRLCDLAREKWLDLVNIAIYHRLGPVPIGEASVLIAVSAPHRREAIGPFKIPSSSFPFMQRSSRI